MSDERTLTVDGQSRGAKGLETVLDILLHDMVLDTVDPTSLQWDRPIFVLRSAHMPRMRAFLHALPAYCKAPALHIMSHARDEKAIRSMTDLDIAFHPYPTPGRYKLEEVPASMLQQLRSVGFGTLVFLDGGTAGEGLDEVERLLSAIGESRMVSFRADDRFARPENWRLHRRATAAFYGLVDWYHFRLDPGAPAGPVLPSEALAAAARVEASA